MTTKTLVASPVTVVMLSQNMTTVVKAHIRWVNHKATGHILYILCESFHLKGDGEKICTQREMAKTKLPATVKVLDLPCNTTAMIASQMNEMCHTV